MTPPQTLDRPSSVRAADGYNSRQPLGAYIDPLVIRLVLSGDPRPGCS